MCPVGTFVGRVGLLLSLYATGVRYECTSGENSIVEDAIFPLTFIKYVLCSPEGA